MALERIDNPALSERTSLGFGGCAAVELIVREENDLDAVADFLGRNALPPFVLGRGTNLLARNARHELALLRAGLPSYPDRIEEQNGKIIVRAGAGLRLPGLLGWAQKAGFSGLEGLTGIPGSVGGAVAMNAGSYGVEFGDVLTRIRLWTPAQGLFWMHAADCEFGYRHFDPGCGKALIWEVELALDEASSRSVHKAMKQAYAQKRKTQPVTAKSAGCVFKNPEGDSAGRLLDKAGFRGARLGGVGFSEMHANFLVNMGSGTGEEALELMDQARMRVRELFGVNLETEVIIL